MQGRNKVLFWLKLLMWLAANNHNHSFTSGQLKAMLKFDYDFGSKA